MPTVNDLKDICSSLGIACRGCTKKDDLMKVLTIHVKGKSYTLTGRLGSGSFGSVYIGIPDEKGDSVAVKVGHSRWIDRECYIYSTLKNTRHVPLLIGCLADWPRPKYSAVVIERLGYDLKKRRRIFDGFSKLDVLTVGIQVLCAIEKLHNIGYVHRDIKPSNIATGTCLRKYDIVLLDFGLAEAYGRDSEWTKVGFSGNKMMASQRALRGYPQSRRDDIESIGLLLVYLSIGHAKYMSRITSTSDPSKIAEGLPALFASIISTGRTLGYSTKPNYEYLRNNLSDLYAQESIDGAYHRALNESRYRHDDKSMVLVIIKEIPEGWYRWIFKYNSTSKRYEQTGRDPHPRALQILLRSQVDEGYVTKIDGGKYVIPDERIKYFASWCENHDIVVEWR